jgi:hypothetical protein
VRGLLAVLALVFLLIPTGSGAKSAAPLIGTRGSILSIAADGSRVAIATTGINQSCDRIVVWSPPGPAFATFKTGVHCGGEPSGGENLGQVALADTRVAWIEMSAGNNQYLNLETATLQNHKTREAAYAVNGNGAGGNPDGQYLGNLYGDGSLLAYNTWDVCAILPPGAVDDLADPCTGKLPRVTREEHVSSKEQIWGLVSGKRSKLHAGSDGFRIVAVDGGRIAAQRDSGAVTIFSGSGAALKTIAVPRGKFRGTAMQGKQLVTLRNGKLEVYDPGSGTFVKTIRVSGRSPVLRDVHGGIAVYVSGADVHSVRLSDGKDVAIHVPGSRPDAQIEGPGLFYSYNVAAKGRVVFVSHAALLQKF